MADSETFHEYRSRFTALADMAEVAATDPIDDLYNALT